MSNLHSSPDFPPDDVKTTFVSLVKPEPYIIKGTSFPSRTSMVPSPVINLIKKNMLGKVNFLIKAVEGLGTL